MKMIHTPQKEKEEDEWKEVGEKS
jgi:ubiquitin C-terminal hydrolase